MSTPHPPLDAAALAEHARFLRALARELVGDEGTAEDLVQETLLAAWRGAPGDPAGLRRWLRRVLRNLAFRGWRTRERRGRREVAAARQEALPSAAEIAERAELHRILGEAVAALEEPLRTVVHLRFHEGLLPAEIAARLGVPRETVRSRLRRAVALLRERLDREANGGRPAWIAALAGTRTRLAATSARGVLRIGGIAVGTKALLLGACGLVVLLLFLAVTAMHPAWGPAGQRSSSVADALLPAAPSERPDVDTAAAPGALGPVRAPLAAPGERKAVGTLLSGRVLDVDGAPVSGVEVALSRPAAPDMMVLDLAYAGRSVPVDTATTDGDGAFEFPVLPAIAYDLRAPARPCQDPGCARAWSCFAGTEVTLRLEPSCAVAGRVVRASDRAPVAAARVNLWRSAGGEGRGAEAVARTDADGRYRLDGLAAGGYSLELLAPDLLPVWKGLELRPGETRALDLELEQGLTVTGAVTDADTGLPVAGAEVSDDWRFVRVSRTDARGAYSLGGVPGGTFDQVWARAPGYGVRGLPRPDPVGGRIALDIALRRGRRARGRVVGSDGGPLAGVYVAAAASRFVASGVQAVDWPSTRTDASGRFELRDLRSDLRHVLLLRAPGRASAAYDFPPEEELAEVDLGDLVLGLPGRIEGRVVGETGRPAEGVEVTLFGWNADRYRLGRVEGDSIDGYVGERRVRTRADGRFRFGELAAGQYGVKVTIPDPGRVDPVPVELAAGGVTSGIELVVHPGRVLAGRAEDEDGNPVVDLEVQVTPSAGMPGRPDVRRTGPDGSFHFEELARGSYLLTTGSPEAPVAGHPLLPTRIDHIDSGREDVRLVLPRAEPVRGVVLDDEGSPVSGAFVRTLDAAGHELDRVRSGSDGAFSVGAPAGGRVELVANPALEGSAGGGILPWSFTVEGHVSGVAAGSDGVAVRLRRSR